MLVEQRQLVDDHRSKGILRHAAVFLRDDAVNFIREESHTDWKQAILAVLSNPLYYKPAEFDGNIVSASSAGRRSPARAKDSASSSDTSIVMVVIV